MDVPAAGGGAGPALRQRGGIVVEFRNLPQFYDGVNAWHTIARKFLKKAIALNSQANR